VAFLSLVVSIISDDKSTTFNVGMFFAFISVGIHFGNIVIAGRGIALTAQIDELVPGKDASYFRSYLAACEQLQFVATLVFILSTVIMTFVIFSSIAYPVVLLVLSVVGLVFIFSSVYWEVSMTFRNLKFLAKNVQHLKASWNTISNRHRRRVFPNLYRREKPPM
jgi:glucan phosphoethanolaminetransferase (alkaline phosphatase superfamily)